METSAAHLKETIQQILDDTKNKALKEKFADQSQIEKLVQKIQNEIQESHVGDLVILKQQLGIVLTDMENMDTRAFKYPWKTRFPRGMIIGSSLKDLHDDDDDDITEKTKVMEDFEDKATNFGMYRELRSNTKDLFNILEGGFVRHLELVGREKEKEEIIDQLVSRRGEVPVIIIAGISGIGKTKLASSVCEDMNVQHQVGMAARVIGVTYNTFDADSIAKQAIRSVVTATIVAPHQHGRITENNNLNIIVILDDCLDWRVEIEDKDVKALQDKLKEDWTVEIEGIDVKALQKELEDVGVQIEGIDVEAVDKLKKARPLVTAVMIITTSSCHVAMARNITASPVKSYALPELNEKEIESLWELIKKEAGDDWKIDAGDYWIVGKSRGVPGALLTAMLTAMLMLRYSYTQLTDSGLMEQLTYSYYDEGLPHLCFAYCSLFPQDYLFDAERLIHLWMAEGFLKPASTSSSKPEEEIGRDYLMDLVGRSIFQDVKEDELGQIRSFRMHPLMHDIARFVADRKNITVDPKGYKVHQNVQRASFDLRLHFSHGIPSHPLFDKVKGLRSILFFAANTQSSWLHRHVVLENIFRSFKSLVVLDLRGLKITAVPNSIGELKSLEYLDLSQNDIEKLPSSIAKLSKLQTLKLSRCYSLRDLPKDFKKLEKLKHLDMEGCMGLNGMPPQMSTLSSSLHTLTAFVASQKETMGGLEELRKLNELRGYLEILYLDRVKPKPDGKKFLNEKQLQRLKLRWDLGVGQAERSDDKSVLDSLEPHSHLEVLFLEGYQGESLPNWLNIQFTGLVKLSLHNCPGCKYLSQDDQLPKLKILELVRLDKLEYIVNTKKDGKDTDFYKNLQELTIIDCPTLERWWGNCPKEVEIFFARISKLHVHNCPKLEQMPRLDIVVEDSTSTSFGKELVLEGSSLNLLQKSVKEDSIPFENLHIQNCKDLENLSNFFQHLGSLQRLTIENCAEIKLDDGKSKQHEELEKKILAQTNLEDGKSKQLEEDGKSKQHEELEKNFAQTNLEDGKSKQLEEDGKSKQLEKLEKKTIFAQTSKILEEKKSFAQPSKILERTSKILEELEKKKKKKIFAQTNLEDGKSNQYWEGLKSLRFLTLREMPNIRSLSFGDSVATLRELTLHSCHGLTFISDSMIGKLTSLRELSLHNCHGLTSISDSIGNLTSLRRLEISKCNKLKSLPKTMEKLKSLKTLIILDCDLLLPRCQRETGDDWPQISHIADIQVK